ncbi:MAG: tetraacyldisaccharide 4'-kinase [Crocinitomicaceae bacterium]|nr:MAG: tetraacyldisaccharide 4'-kinase [Crocinitomicaceae bacterium]
MQFFRKLLWPLSLVYGFVTLVRNKCYDWGIFNSYAIPKKSICVGNLSVGGTGKTPHVAYLAEFLNGQIETSILSRGYGRKTSGFRLVNTSDSAENVGDEPLFYATIFDKNVHVAVCEKRAEGVQELQQLFLSNQLIILDDAYQHRAVKAGLNILLTEYNAPFSSDLVLPAGNLREFRAGKKRADLVIVTKCPKSITDADKRHLANSLKVNTETLFFSEITYAPLRSFGKECSSIKKVLLVTGIANPSPLIAEIEQQYKVEHLKFGDHHAFSKQDIEEIHQKFDTFACNETIILTTEKDFMRLKAVSSSWKLDDYPWYYQPITVKIDNENKFKALINQYVNTI